MHTQRRKRISVSSRQAYLSQTALLSLLVVGLFICVSTLEARPIDVILPRGGAATRVKDLEAYNLLAKAIHSELESDDGSLPELEKVVKALKRLSSSQKTFKGLDGAAHEAYRRTHSTEELDATVSGRARRTAARTGATADGLGACELCELVLPNPPNLEGLDGADLSSPNGTLAGREILLNVTDIDMQGSKVSVIVLFEPSYRGGAGTEHGGIADLTPAQRRGRARGRLIVVVGDSAVSQLPANIEILRQEPRHVRLGRGSVTSEVASVQPALYKAAGKLLTELEPLLRSHNTSAIHFVGHSLAGGIASLAAVILDGRLPMPGDKKKKKSKGKEDILTNVTSSTDTNSTIQPLQGLGKERCSAVTLGAPPSMSANVPADFVTSLLYGDDIICRTSKESLGRLLKRSRGALKHSGLIGRQMNWMTDTLSLATSNLKSHAHGSEGEEARLAVPGRSYLIRPRRLGGICSIHEVGAQLKGGREALRAIVLWQLNDVLLSKSLWKHHSLDSYIHGLDRVQLREVNSDDEEEE